MILATTTFLAFLFVLALVDVVSFCLAIFFTFSGIAFAAICRKRTDSVKWASAALLELGERLVQSPTREKLQRRRHAFKDRSELPKRLENEAKRTNELIIRDFVESWFTDLGDDARFPTETRRLLARATNQIFNLLRQIPTNHLVRDVLLLFSDHVTHFQKTTPYKNRWEVYAQSTKIHPGLASGSRTGELNHIRFLLNILLELVLAQNEADCVGGAFLLNDALASNALISLIDHFSQPLNVNRIVVDVLEKLSPELKAELRRLDDEEVPDEINHVTTKDDDDDDDDVLFPDNYNDDTPLSSSRCATPTSFDEYDESRSNSVDDVLVGDDSNDFSPVIHDISRVTVPPPDHVHDFSHMLAITHVETIVQGDFKVFAIKYSDAIWKTSAEDGDVDLSRSVFRRYSEFVSLDKALKLSAFGHLVKRVQLPARGRFRGLNPFAKSDDVFLNQRRVHLEAYLHILLSKPPVRNSNVLKEFLAFDKDPQVAFVGLRKRANSFIAGLSGALNKAKINIREGLPSIKSMRGKSANVPAEKSSYSALQYFHAYLLSKSWLHEAAATPIPRLTDQLIQNLKTHKVSLQDSALCDGIFSLGAEALDGKNVWLRRHGVQDIFLNVFGSLVDRLINRELQDVLTEARWIHYLRLLRESLWPEGKLREGEEEASADEKAKAKQMAYNYLRDFVPVVVRLAIGPSTFDEGLRGLLESLQDAQINRHLLYCLLDLLLLHLLVANGNSPGIVR